VSGRRRRTFFWKGKKINVFSITPSVLVRKKERRDLKGRPERTVGSNKTVLLIGGGEGTFRREKIFSIYAQWGSSAGEAVIAVGGGGFSRKGKGP